MKLRSYSAVVTFLLVLAVIALAFQATDENSSAEVKAADTSVRFDACKLANVLIMESNERIRSHRLDTKVLQKFLAVSGDTSQRNFERSRDASDLRAAKHFRQFSRDLEGTKFVPIKPTEDCVR